MKWLPIALSVVFLLMAVPALTAERPAVDLRRGSTISAGEVTPTPEMWFYEQYVQQYQDPKLAVRRKAEEQSAQRRARIAARRWFGFCNLRPVAGTDPVHGDYSPGWSSGNNLYPFRWNGYRGAGIVVRVRRSTGVY